MTDVEKEPQKLASSRHSSQQSSIWTTQMPWRAPITLGCKTMSKNLIYQWQEARIDPSGCNPDTPVNRLIAEREEQILALQVR